MKLWSFHYLASLVFSGFTVIPLTRALGLEAWPYLFIFAFFYGSVVAAAFIALESWSNKAASIWVVLSLLAGIPAFGLLHPFGFALLTFVFVSFALGATVAVVEQARVQKAMEEETAELLARLWNLR